MGAVLVIVATPYRWEWGSYLLRKWMSLYDIKPHYLRVFAFLRVQNQIDESSLDAPFWVTLNLSLLVFIEILTDVIISPPTLLHVQDANTRRKYFLKLVVANAYTNGLTMLFRYANINVNTWKYDIAADTSCPLVSYTSIVIMAIWTGAQHMANNTTTIKTILVIFFFRRNALACACALSVPSDVLRQTCTNICM